MLSYGKYIVALWCGACGNSQTTSDSGSSVEAVVGSQAEILPVQQHEFGVLIKFKQDKTILRVMYENGGMYGLTASTYASGSAGVHVTDDFFSGLL